MLSVYWVCFCFVFDRANAYGVSAVPVQYNQTTAQSFTCACFDRQVVNCMSLWLCLAGCIAAHGLTMCATLQSTKLTARLWRLWAATACSTPKCAQFSIIHFYLSRVVRCGVFVAFGRMEFLNENSISSFSYGRQSAGCRNTNDTQNLYGWAAPKKPNMKMCICNSKSPRRIWRIIISIHKNHRLSFSSHCNAAMHHAIVTMRNSSLFLCMLFLWIGKTILRHIFAHSSHLTFVQFSTEK